MTISLENLKNTTRPFKKRKLLGRGLGCKKGKTCGRGHKGAGSRSGYKRPYGEEGGGVPLHKRLPTRGFSNAAFAKCFTIVNLEQIELAYNNGEVVSLSSLKEKGIIRNSCNSVKLLGRGTFTKKLSVEGLIMSESAKEKIEAIK